MIKADTDEDMVNCKRTIRRGSADDHVRLNLRGMSTAAMCALLGRAVDWQAVVFAHVQDGNVLV